MNRKDWPGPVLFEQKSFNTEHSASIFHYLIGRAKCFFGSHDMQWGFGSPQPGHCVRGCGHEEVDAD